ncbi:MAG: DUF4241 domain-containing protein [Acidaminococcales bacterium]|jgi:hypothetical protein|nr:DUF4241 domain-containing protein [Acidaminococcales bacterium]
MQPTKEWLELYGRKRLLMVCGTDLNAYFTADEIAGKKLDRLSVGVVSLPSGEIIVCDPLVYLDDASPYFRAVPPGEYEVTLAVVAPDDGDCARYAAARVRFSDAEAVRYEEALAGDEDLHEVNEQGEGFGFCVDAGLGCICDVKARDAYLAFAKDWYDKADESDDLYTNYFADLLSENAKTNPLYQRDGGDWLNWQVPGTDYHIPIFASGFGDGFYPVWFGFGADGNICSLVVQFIDIEAAYGEEKEP